MPDGVCKTCKAAAVVWEPGDNLYVCIECGTVANDSVLTSSRQPADSQPHRRAKPNESSLPEAFLRLRMRRDARGMIAGVRVVLAVGRSLGSSAEVRNQAVELFHAAFSHPAFLRLRAPSKRILAAACIRVMDRDRELLLSDVSTAADCSPSQLSQMVRQLSIALPATAPTIAVPTVQELVRTLSRRAGFSAQLQRRTADLMHLCHGAWLVEGRDPLAFVMSAMYLVWKAEKPAERLTVRLVDFNKEHDLKYRGVQRERHYEILNLLATLGAHIPWVKPAQLKYKKICLLIDDICRFQAQLRNSHDEDVKTEKGEEDENGSDDQNCDGLTVDDSPSNSVTKHSENECNEDKEEELVDKPKKPGVGTKTVKRLCTFLPPVMAKRRVRQPEANVMYDFSHIHDDELSEKDISDKDLIKYVKLDAEVEAMVLDTQ